MKGRPEGSIIRERIISIIDRLGTGYGYEIYKIYKQIFGKVHIRSIYYNLKKGIEKEEIIVVNVKRELGDYSWGDEVEKVYFSLGPYAKKETNLDDIKKIEQITSPKNKIEIDWHKEIKQIIEQLKKEIEDYGEKYSKMSNQGKKLLQQRINEKFKKVKQYSEGKITKEEIEDYLKNIEQLLKEKNISI
ncbi:Uncharacterised protein [Candidatus Tiddalikarchaeum anstoanum]|nr:Uncharacterised protein [Candidatus Tiddalikarchaeum anstoanum]